MPETSRYAIYLAPKPDTALWQFGSRILGYDAATGLDVPGFSLPFVAEDLWHQLTARARQYGFHATIKAPFRLRSGFGEQELISALAAFAAKQKPLPDVQLQLSIMDENAAGGFLALTPHQPCSLLHQLETATVEAMDPFRAPLTDIEIAKRNPEKLTERQNHYLARYGYPFVMEEFRAHFTLSDRLAGAKNAADELNDVMNADLGVPILKLDELVLFKQSSPGARFSIIARLPLVGTL
jgi:2'-5' RNA ligase